MRWHRLHYAELDRAPVNDDIRLRATQTNYRVAALLARDCCVAIAVASGQVMQAELDDLCRGSPRQLHPQSEASHSCLRSNSVFILHPSLYIAVMFLRETHCLSP